MSIDRRTFLLNVLAGAAVATGGCAGSGRNPSPAASDSTIKKAARYLWSQQADDGGFHSTTYGLLRSGQSLTPFVLLALLTVPETEFSPPAGAIERALAFIRANTNSDGALGVMDETAADYPNYATALAICAMVKTRDVGTSKKADASARSGDGLAGDGKLIDSMIAQLRAQQFSEANGWTREHAAYGGWGMGGPIHRPPEPGHVDLSMTRHVLEALRASGASPSDPAMIRALTYLQRSQNPDGGFYFSPVNPEINKAGGRTAAKETGEAGKNSNKSGVSKPAQDTGEAEQSGNRFASYGTATADGLLALRAAGVSEDDPRITRAIAWLKLHHQPDRVPGFSEPSQPPGSGTNQRNGSNQPWATGLRFYYAHAISRALPELVVDLPEQSTDGSFRNAVNLVKEDDPLIATPFALYVLTRHVQST